MRQAQKSNRARGRGNRKGGGGGNNLNRVYESAGPEGKVRGTPQQIVEKYLSLARDAQTSGDRVTAENFLQHAEHYQRIVLLATGAYEEKREASSSDSDDEDDDNGGATETTPRAEERRQHANGRESAEAEPAPAPEPGPAASSDVGGLTTIDTSDENAPDLLVATEEANTSQPRRPRRPRRRVPAAEDAGSGNEQSAPAESAPVTSDTD